MLEEEQQHNIASLRENNKDLNNIKYNYLYPHQDDPLFNEKLMRKKEFYDIMNPTISKSFSGSFSDIPVTP